MLKTNRLIDDFKRQTKITIWKHIEAMAVNYAVYSYHLNGFDPYLRDKDIYVYSNSDNMVVVCLDSCGRHDNRTYEESDGMDSIIYSAGTEPRESMVWKLKETLQIMRNRLQKCQYNIEVYGVLLTEAHITNADDLEDMWEANHIKVFEGYAGAAVFAPMIFTIPFPTMVDIGFQQDMRLIHGGNWMRNVMCMNSQLRMLISLSQQLMKTMILSVC